MKALLVDLPPAWNERLREIGKSRWCFQKSISISEAIDASELLPNIRDYNLVVVGINNSVEKAADICRRFRVLLGNKRPQILVCDESLKTNHIQRLYAAGADDFLVDSHDSDQIELRLHFAECRAGNEPCRQTNISDERLCGLFEIMPDPLLIVDRDGNVVFLNRDLPELNRGRSIGADGFRFVHPAHKLKCHEVFARALATKTMQSGKIMDVQGKAWRYRVVPLEKAILGGDALIICSDIAKRNRSSKKLLGDWQLFYNVIDAYERDCRLVTSDFYDNMVQRIAASLFHLQAFEQLRGSHPDKADLSFKEAINLIRQSIEGTNRLLCGLPLSVLDDYGIIDAIRFYICDLSNKYEAGISFQHDVLFKRLPPSLENTIFRIILEAVYNACRHSKSPTVELLLLQHGDELQITVVDKGMGFDPRNVPEKSSGLKSIRERALLLGGSVKINSRPGKGAEINVEIPIPRYKI